MKVLFITHYSGLYGANKSLLQLILHLREEYEIDSWVLVPASGKLVDALELHHINYIIAKTYNWRVKIGQVSIFALTIKKILNFFLIRIAAFKCYNKNFDLIHSNTSVSNLGGYLKGFLKIPHVWHFREFGEKDYCLKFSISDEKAFEWVNRYTDRVILISNAMVDHYSGSIQKDKMIRIYNGVLPPTRFEKKNYGKVLNFCVLGVITETKNQVEAIRAFDELVNVNGYSDIHLFIVGDGEDEYVNSLMELVSSKNLGKFITFTGFQENITSILSYIDVGIVPSVNEAFGRVTIEFMMHKIPVIVSDSGANTEIVSDKVGMVYKLGDINSLADCMLYSTQNKDKIREIGEKGFDHAMSNFNSLANARKIHELYKEHVG